MNLSHGYGTPPDEADAARLLNRALDLGITLLDTAALYGGGRNEALLGRAVGHRRAEFTLASKGVLDQVDGRRVLDGRPEAITASLDRSLARLGTDHIDLHYLHRLDRDVPIEESVGALVRAKEAGKIGAIGLSEMSADTLARAQAVHPIAAMQAEYSPVVRNAEVAVLAACRATGTGFVAFSPVSRGLLAGGVADDRYDPGDLRAGMPRFTGARLRDNLAVVARFDALARQAGLTPAQLSLGWVLARGPHVVAIPGTRQVQHLEENVAAAVRPLAPDLVAAVDALFADQPLTGARYPAAMQAQIDTEWLPGEERA
jgi:hypothetical protein